MAEKELPHPYTYWGVNNDGEPVVRYGIGRLEGALGMQVTPTRKIHESLLRERKDAIAVREALLEEKKACAKRGDMEGAKLCKTLAQEQKRRYTAALFHIPWFGEPTGDCPDPMPPHLWPVDLAAELAAVGRLIEHADVEQ